MLNFPLSHPQEKIQSKFDTGIDTDPNAGSSYFQNLQLQRADVRKGSSRKHNGLSNNTRKTLNYLENVRPTRPKGQKKTTQKVLDTRKDKDANLTIHLDLATLLDEDQKSPRKDNAKSNIPKPIRQEVISAKRQKKDCNKKTEKPGQFSILFNNKLQITVTGTNSKKPKTILETQPGIAFRKCPKSFPHLPQTIGDHTTAGQPNKMKTITSKTQPELGISTAKTQKSVHCATREVDGANGKKIILLNKPKPNLSMDRKCTKNCDQKDKLNPCKLRRECDLTKSRFKVERVYLNRGSSAMITQNDACNVREDMVKSKEVSTHNLTSCFMETNDEANDITSKFNEGPERQSSFGIHDNHCSYTLRCWSKINELIDQKIEALKSAFTSHSKKMNKSRTGVNTTVFSKQEETQIDTNKNYENIAGCLKKQDNLGGVRQRTSSVRFSDEISYHIL